MCHSLNGAEKTQEVRPGPAKGKTHTRAVNRERGNMEATGGGGVHEVPGGAKKQLMLFKRGTNQVPVIWV